MAHLRRIVPLLHCNEPAPLTTTPRTLELSLPPLAHGARYKKFVLRGVRDSP